MNAPLRAANRPEENFAAVRTTALPCVASRVASSTVAPSAEAPSTRRLELPSGVTHAVNWRYATPIVAIHLLALLVITPWLFSWWGVIAFVAGVYFYGAVGINLSYHRLLTHRSFAVPAWLERTFVVVAVCCLEDSPASWVAAHRLHHSDADHRDDPHSPLAGAFWGHLGWLLMANPKVRSLSVFERYARDVLRTPFYLRLQRGELRC